MTKEKLLEIRKRIKQKKPNFLRQEGNKRKKLKNCWRQPKGIHSKMRRKFKSRRLHPSQGFRSPKLVRGLHHSGLKVEIIKKMDDLKSINPKTEGIIISKTIGGKKRLPILKKIKELKLKILNVKDLDADIKKIEQRITQRKEESVKKEQHKKKAMEESIKKAEEKKKKEETKKVEGSEEEQKEEEKPEEKKEVKTQPKEEKEKPVEKIEEEKPKK